MLFTVHGNISRITNDSFEQLVQRTKEFIEKNIKYGDLSSCETHDKFVAHDKDRKISISIDKEQNFLSLTLNEHPNACLNSNSFGSLTIADTKKLLDESEVHESIYRISENGQLYFFVDACKYKQAFSEIIIGKEGFIKKLVQEKLTSIVDDMVYQCTMYGKYTTLEKFLAERTNNNNISFDKFLPLIEEKHPGFTEELRSLHNKAKQERIDYSKKQMYVLVENINFFGNSVIDLILGRNKLKSLISSLVDVVGELEDETYVVNNLVGDYHKRLYTVEKESRFDKNYASESK